MSPAKLKSFRDSLTIKLKRQSNNSHFKELLDSAENSSTSTINETQFTPSPSNKQHAVQSLPHDPHDSAITVVTGSLETLSTAKTKTSSTSTTSPTNEPASSTVDPPAPVSAANTDPNTSAPPPVPIHSSPAAPLPPLTLSSTGKPSHRPSSTLPTIHSFATDQPPPETPTPPARQHTRIAKPHPLPPLPPDVAPRAATPSTKPRARPDRQPIKPHFHALPPLPAPAPSPLTDLQFHCFTQHREMLYIHPPRHPLGQAAGCMVCPFVAAQHAEQSSLTAPRGQRRRAEGEGRGHRRRSNDHDGDWKPHDGARWRCKWCYLYVCAGCRSRLVGEECARDLKMMVVGRDGGADAAAPAAPAVLSKRGGGNEDACRSDVAVGDGDGGTDRPDGGQEWPCYI